MEMSENYQHGHRQDISLFHHSISLEILITAHVVNVMRATSLTFSEIYKDNKTTDIETTKGVIVSNDNTIPRSETIFNNMIKCSVKQISIDKNYIQYHFIIKTMRTLGNIKDRLYH